MNPTTLIFSNTPVPITRLTEDGIKNLRQITFLLHLQQSPEGLTGWVSQIVEQHNDCSLNSWFGTQLPESNFDISEDGTTVQGESGWDSRTPNINDSVFNSEQLAIEGRSIWVLDL